MLGCILVAFQGVAMWFLRVFPLQRVTIQFLGCSGWHFLPGGNKSDILER